METKGIYPKIFSIKNEIGKMTKDTTNPFYKSLYFDINQLIEHLSPVLIKHDILLIQPIKEGKVFSILIDLESGESTESSIELPQTNDPQKVGSAITYYRRYSLQSLLGIQAEDDDGNKASGINKNTKASDGIIKSTSEALSKISTLDEFIAWGNSAEGQTAKSNPEANKLIKGKYNNLTKQPA